MMINKKVLILSAVFIIAVVAASCTPFINKPETKTPSTQEPAVVTPKKEDISMYYPLKVGNEWVYEGEGNEYASYAQKVTYSKNNKYQVMIDNGGTRAANIYEIKDDSIIHTYMEGEVYDERQVLDNADNFSETIIRLPIESGNKWVSEQNSYEIIETNASVTVPAGTFNECIVIKEVYKDQTAHRNYFIKKGIGLVKSEHKTNDGFVVASLLKSYKLVAD